ncbi:hypothetical protein V5O48_016122 [Marasmius crinis-equi]|uniref:KOW domain-containing protein n=1 Tax=Marasmius crinis-equi TaxID=585013 RepID=A0ABR3ESX9_9AGAR
MTSLFLDIEAQVAVSSDEEELDFGVYLHDQHGNRLAQKVIYPEADDGFIDDVQTPNDEFRPARPSSGVSAQDGDVAIPFLDDLERRYTGPSVSNRAESSSRLASDQHSDHTILGKRKASEAIEALHPVLAIAARRPSPPPTFTSTSTSQVTLKPIHPLTKQRLPVREEPTHIPDHRRVFETDPNTIAMFGPWRNTPPSSGKPEKGKYAQTLFGSNKRKETERWSKWAHRKSQNRVRTEYAPGEWVPIGRGTYKGDVGQVWKAHIRQKTENEVASEQQSLQEALNQGKTPPEPSLEFIFEGYWVLVIPRLPPPHLTQPSSLKLKPGVVKGRNRFGTMLFNPRQYDIIIPEKYIKSTQGFEIDGHLLSHGLLIKLFKRDSLDPASTITLDTIRAFENHPHSQRFPFPIPGQWRFLEGEEVDVDWSADGESGRGVVHLPGEGDICEIEYGAGGLHATPIHLIWKVINVGDYVTVVSGDKVGKEGLVVEKHGKIIAISERGSRRGIDFFVHINSVTQARSTFDYSAIPWLDKEVTIIKGPNCEQHGIIKDVVQKPHLSTVSLWLFLPQLQKTVEVDVSKVAAKGTREPLWKMFPLRPDQKHYKFNRFTDMRTGKVPWIGLLVGVIKGPHKGKQGLVKDINRTQNAFAVSGLMVTVELNQMGNPLEPVYYDFVRERSTGLTLCGYHPLTEKEAFFRPNPAFVGAGVKFGQRQSRFVSLSRFSSTETYTMLEPGEPDVGNHIACKDVDKSRELDPADEGLSIPELDPNAPKDCWNPYWEYPSSPQPEPTPPSSSPPAPTRPVLHGQTQAQYEAAGRHPLARPELVGISIMVDILHGYHKKAAVYVKLARTPTGTIHGILRKGKGKRPHKIPLTSLAICDKRVEPSRDDPLLVVISGPHLGTFVHRITHFYVDEKQTGDDKWLILAVVDKENPVDKLTGVIIECGVDELAFVEESSTDRFRATHGAKKQVRDEARLQTKPEVRKPDTGNLDRFINIIHSQLLLDTAGPST